MRRAKLDEQNISVAGIPAINADGDWIVQDGASTDAIVSELHAILLEHFRLNVRFEKSQVTKDALIASGAYLLRRIPDVTVGDLQIYGDVLDHPRPGDSVQGGGFTDPAYFWSMLSGYLGVAVVDESSNEPAKINWALSRSIAHADTEPDRRRKILDNITKQTGVTFKQEKRAFAVWKLTLEPGKDTTSFSGS